MSMEEKTNEALRVSIFDPTGNITALVESPVAPEEQSAAAARIMERFPQVEQVGFGLAALGRIHRGNIVVEFVEVTDCRLAVVTDSCELVGIEISPFKKL